MSAVLDLPYDVLRDIFTRLTAVDVLNFLRISRKLYYPLIDDNSIWYIFCAPYGITDTSLFRKRSFRIIYGRLLHRDYPFKGNIVEFRIVPDNWLRRGEPIIVGDVWEFAGTTSPIGFIPWKKSTPQTANVVQTSWHVLSERDPVHNGIPPPWEGDPPPILYNRDRRGPTKFRYIFGLPKPAAIAFYPPPNGQQSDVRIPELHNPPHYYSSYYKAIIPRYYLLRQPTQEGDDPASRQWRPESIEGLWLGDYGVHGTESLFLEYAAADFAIRAWKITGDSNVPRGACSWDLDLRQYASDSSSSRRSYEGRGTLAQRGFRMSKQRQQRGRVGDS
ncbi:hypothetical protein GY45DRAFT_1335465 [Cubamyces sp. BRFM 1775]|nr:hypothetical protein GY45DRAFT_1335465 [Cubamyces sp. BRFM 1775]